MEKTSLHIAAFAVLILACASCRKPDTEILTDMQNTFTIEIFCPDADSTKTGINGLQPYWNGGDKLWLSDGTNSVQATVSSEYDGKTSARLEVGGLDSTKTIYALYPYDETASISSGKIEMDIRPDQDGTFSSAHRMVGIKNASDPGIKLSNASAILKLDTGREDLMTVQLANSSNKFTGRYKITPSTGAKSGAVNALNTVRMDFGKGIGSHYFSVYAGSIPAGSRFVFITKEGRMGSIVTQKANTVAAGSLYDLGNIDESIVFDQDPAVDLSQDESANCYITTAAGSYRLKAVKGNSITSIGEAAYSRVVWETCNTSTAPKAGSIISETAYCNGYVYFRIPENAPDGNALIAACDRYGNILWSWHIWNLKDGVTDQFYSGTSYSGATMMDRNLGALSAEAGSDLAIGFYYQYGRKDPFTGSSSRSSSKSTAITGDAQSSVASSAETGNQEYATAHPRTFITKSSANWNTDNANYWNAYKKTIYDPCPPGYHIPSEAAFAAFTKSNLKWDATNLGRKITLSGKVIWFPASGNKSSGSGNLASAGTTGYYYFDESSSNVGYNNMINSSSRFTGQTSGHASAFSVRCQKNTVSSETQSLVLIYDVEDINNSVSAPYTTDKIFSPLSITWGSGDPQEYFAKQMLYHRFDAPGTYSLIVESHDVNEFTLNPVGDVTFIDLSAF